MGRRRELSRASKPGAERARGGCRLCSEGRREDPHIRSCTPGSLMKRRQRGCQLCFKGDQSVRRRFLFLSFWPQPQHAEVPQPGIKPARQQQPSHSRDCRIPNPHTTRTLMALPFHPVPFLWCHCPIITTSRDFAANSAAQVFRTFLAISQNRNSISQNRNTLHRSVDKKVSQNHLPLPHMRDTEGFFFFFGLFAISWPLPRHMEVRRLGGESEL